jgi:hypothetical protein
MCETLIVVQITQYFSCLIKLFTLKIKCFKLQRKKVSNGKIKFEFSQIFIVDSPFVISKSLPNRIEEKTSIKVNSCEETSFNMSFNKQKLV